MTDCGFDKSTEMLTWSAVLSSSFRLLDASATLYPFAAKARATCRPILGPEPKMRITGDVVTMILDLEFHLVRKLSDLTVKVLDLVAVVFLSTSSGTRAHLYS
jgi:hypothetical protein